MEARLRNGRNGVAFRISAFGSRAGEAAVPLECGKRNGGKSTASEKSRHSAIDPEAAIAAFVYVLP
jgi:hypothetical protein